MIITAHISRNAPSVEVVEGDGKVARVYLTSIGIRGADGAPGMDIDASTRIMLIDGPVVPPSDDPESFDMSLPLAKATWRASEDLLDLTNPNLPTILEAGVYAFNLAVLAQGQSVLDDTAWVGMDIDGIDAEHTGGDGWDHYQDFHFSLKTDDGVNPVGSGCVVGWCPAGATVDMHVRTASHDVGFKVQGTIQQVRGVASSPGGDGFDHSTLQPRTILVEEPPTTQVDQLFGIWWDEIAPTTGVIRLTWGGDETEDIPFDAEVGVWVAALEALPSIGAGNVAAGGTPYTNLIEPDDEVDIVFSGSLGGVVQEAPTITKNTTDATLSCETWGTAPSAGVDGVLAQMALDTVEPAGYECTALVAGHAVWTKRWPYAGTQGPVGPTGPAGAGATPLAVFQFAPDTLDVANIGTAWGNVAGTVSISPITIPPSGRFRATIYGYLKGGGSDGTVYFMLNDYSTGLIKYGPTVAVPLLAGERKLFNAQILVNDHPAGEHTPTLNIQVCADVGGITWRSFNPGGLRNPTTPPDVATEGGPTLILVEVA